MSDKYLTVETKVGFAFQVGIDPIPDWFNEILRDRGNGAFDYVDDCCSAIVLVGMYIFKDQNGNCEIYSEDNFRKNFYKLAD